MNKNTESTNASAGFSATRAVASVFGVLAGLGGIRHSIGEMLQGDAAPVGLVIDSWTEGPIATNMGGEPAMTIVPNLFVTGALTFIVSSAVLVWAAAFVQRKSGGWILVLLSMVMLLVGGGFGPPVIGVLAGVAGLGINAQPARWRTRLPAGLRRLLARSWPWVFAVSVINGIFLFAVSLILVVFFGMNDPGLFLNSFFFAVVSLILATITGLAYDTQKGELPWLSHSKGV